MTTQLPSMPLSDLQPELVMFDDEDGKLYFMCPLHKGAPGWVEGQRIKGHPLPAQYAGPICRVEINVTRNPERAKLNPRLWLLTGAMPNISTEPSINRDATACHWHGYVTGGKITSCPDTELK